MNSVAILLAIVILVLIYILYSYFSTTASVIVSSGELSQSNTAITTLASPSSGSYAYGIWLYVNDWDNSKDKTILVRENNFRLYLSKTTPTLNMAICRNPLPSETGTQISILPIMANFPVQRWVHIVVSVDSGLYVDGYINGKLVTSQQLPTIAIQPSSSSSTTSPGTPLYVGSGGFSPSTTAVLYSITSSSSDDGKVHSTDSPGQFRASFTKLIRWPNAVSPQDVWNNYMQGTGQTSAMNPYNVQMAVFKNNVPTVQIGLFPFTYSSSS
jgi:hypothetical protein